MQKLVQKEITNVNSQKIPGVILSGNVTTHNLNPRIKKSYKPKIH